MPKRTATLTVSETARLSCKNDVSSDREDTAGSFGKPLRLPCCVTGMEYFVFLVTAFIVERNSPRCNPAGRGGSTRLKRIFKGTWVAKPAGVINPLRDEYSEYVAGNE